MGLKLWYSLYTVILVNLCGSCRVDQPFDDENGLDEEDTNSGKEVIWPKRTFYAVWSSWLQLTCRIHPSVKLTLTLPHGIIPGTLF